MSLTDPRGVRHSGCSPEALALLEQALLTLARFRGDPMALAEQALAADPSLVGGHLIKAHMLAFAMERSLVETAGAALAAAGALAMDARERTHIAALRAWLAGDYDRGLDLLDSILAEHPRDLLALMMAHQGDFFTGRTTALLARPTAALAAWSPDLPGHGAVLAMRAFGLEENGRLDEAEALGRAVVAADPLDAYAIHAVSHVLEMGGRAEEGIAWCAVNEPGWAEGSFFSTHNGWHLALHHVDRDEPEAALALWDRHIRPKPESIMLNLADAASLLWRLGLAGADTGGRWAALLPHLQRHAEDGHYVFADVHAMLGFAATGDEPAAMRLLAAQARMAEGTSAAAAMTRAAGLPLARAFWDFGRGRHGAAVDALLAARPAWRQMGGSHAQRELLDLTLIEAAIRDRRWSLARDLLDQRLATRPASRRSRIDRDRVPG